MKKKYASYKQKGKNLVGYNLFICHGTVQKVRKPDFLRQSFLVFQVLLYIYIFETCISYISLLIFVSSGDSSGISVTGETPQERGLRDEEAHRTPHGKRPLGTKISADQDFLISPTSYIVQPK